MSPTSTTRETAQVQEGANAIGMPIASVPLRLLIALFARALRRARALVDLSADDPFRRLCLDTVEAVVRLAEAAATGKNPSAPHLGALSAFCRAAADVLDGSARRTLQTLALARELLQVIERVIDHPRTAEKSTASVVSLEQLIDLLAGIDAVEPPGRLVELFLMDARLLQTNALLTADTIDPSPSGPLGPLWPVPGTGNPLEEFSLEDAADEWRWIHEQRAAGRFDAFLGKHVAVYRHQVLGASLDMELLGEVLHERYLIPPERISFVYID